jgi:hypothetical protein
MMRLPEIPFGELCMSPTYGRTTALQLPNDVFMTL